MARKDSSFSNVVELLSDVDKASSYFVEVEGTRLKLKRFLRGNGPFTQYLRATALPVGKYHVDGNRVIHTYDEKLILEELRIHQQDLRMRSPEFRASINAIAKSAGASVAKLYADKSWIGFVVKLKRKNVDPNKLRLKFQNAGAVTFFDDIQAGRLCVVCADTPLDLLLAWHGYARELFLRLDAECKIEALEQVRSRLVVLRIQRIPSNMKPLITLLQTSVPEGEGALSKSEWAAQLRSRKVSLWWDM